VPLLRCVACLTDTCFAANAAPSPYGDPGTGGQPLFGPDILLDSFCNMTGLTGLYLSQNFMSGTIPDCIASMSSLMVLHLSGNNLAGTIPESLGTMPALQCLLLDSNALSGTIPAALGSLTGMFPKIHPFPSSETSSSSSSEMSAFLDVFVPLDLAGIAPFGLGYLDLSNNALEGARAPSRITPKPPLTLLCE
jgi:Leucine rich repeat